MVNQKTVIAFLVCLSFSSVVLGVDSFFRIYATHNGTENRIYEVDKNNFAPRLGFAWTPNFQGGILNKLVGSADTTVIRGGFSIAYDQINVEQLLQRFPVVIDNILVDQTGNYSLGSSKVINRIRPTDPFLIAGTPGILPTDRPPSFLMFNRNQDVAIQTIGASRNPLGPTRILLNNPAGIRPTGGCMTQNFFGVLEFSNTAGTLLVLDDHNNGRPIPSTLPTVFRFPGPDVPISVTCYQSPSQAGFLLGMQLFRQQGNNRPQVRVASRVFSIQNDIFRPVGPQRFYTPFTFTDQEHAFKFRFNSLDFIDRNENGRPDAIVYTKPTTTGSAIFARGINENTLAPNTSPKRLTFANPFTEYYWSVRNFSGTRFEF